MRHAQKLLIIWLCVGMAGPLWAEEEELTDEAIGQAIARLKEYFYSKQDAQGSWEFRSKLPSMTRYVQQEGGETALVAQALLVSGESSQNPNVVRALEFLRNADIEGIYALAIRAHVWSYLPPEYLHLLEKDAGKLMEISSVHTKGLFDYTRAISDGSTRVDHSASQYGLLGLWQASKRGLKIPQKAWDRWVTHFRTFQRDDGGWNYGAHPEAKSTGAMTAAGVTVLYIGQQELHRTRKSPDPKVTESIKRGLDWLNGRFVGVTNPESGGEYNYYYIYCIERVALAGGHRYLNDRDWYRTCAKHIVRTVEKTGSIGDDYTETAFALMFLARGRYPVWVNKLQLPDANWNNHPNDMYFLSQYLSNLREGEINWQVVSINQSPDHWIDAPVAFLSSDQAIQLTDSQKARIKRYIDLGGLLVANPDDGSPSFTKSIRELCQELYPKYEVRRLPGDHTLFDAWYRLSNGPTEAVNGLSNGARELVIFPNTDWGFAIQSDKDPGKKPVWKLASNLFAYATNRGVLNNRLVPPFDAKSKRTSNGEVHIGRARYDGNWLPEPASWEVLGNYLFNNTGLEIVTTPADEEQALSLDGIGETDMKLVHLAGTEAVNLTQSQRDAIQKYLKRGGTILVETPGGHGAFSKSIETQLKQLLERPPVPLSSSDAVISGTGLSDGFDNRRAVYRRQTVLRLKPEPRPRLVAFLDDNSRPMVILSHEDLSLGILGAKHWDILGYQPETSRKLMINIVLWANQQKLEPADSETP